MAKRTVTVKEAAAALRECGMTLRKRDGEYRVNFKGGAEATAYYTDDITDAVLTGRAMAARARRMVDLVCTEHRALGRIARALFIQGRGFSVEDRTTEDAVLNHRRAWNCTAEITIEEAR